MEPIVLNKPGSGGALLKKKLLIALKRHITVQKSVLTYLHLWRDRKGTGILLKVIKNSVSYRAKQKY